MWFKTLFFEHFQFYSKIERDFPYTPCPHTGIDSSINQHPHQRGILVRTDELTLTHHNHPKVNCIYSILQFTFDVVHSMNFYKCIRTCIHYQNIIQSILTALKILCALPIYPSILNSWKPLIFLLLVATIVLPFQERHIIGIIQYGAFLDCFFPLTNWHLRFLHVLITH